MSKNTVNGGGPVKNQGTRPEARGAVPKFIQNFMELPGGGKEGGGVTGRVLVFPTRE